MERAPKQVLQSAAALASDSTGLKATFDLPFVCQRIKQVGMLIEGTSANAQAAVVYVTWSPKNGVTTNQNSSTTGNIAVLKGAGSVSQQGVFIYSKPGINPATGVHYVGWNQDNGVGYNTNEYIFPIGYQILFYVHTANGAANAWRAFVECEQIDVDESDLVYSSQAGTVGYLWDSSYPGVLITPA